MAEGYTESTQHLGSENNIVEDSVTEGHVVGRNRLNNDV